MTALCVRGLAVHRPLVWLAVAAFITLGTSWAEAVDRITVALDQARVIKLPDRATVVVIGDPLIADVSIQTGGIAVVTGKSYGSTNVIVMDRSGSILTEHNIVVMGPPDPTVVVYRGATRETYSCTPDCSPRITLGDDPDFFTKTVGEASTRNNQATAAGAGSR